MNKVNWTAIVALSIVGLLVLLVGGSLLSFAWRGWGAGGGWMGGYGGGMMGPGMMGGWGFGPFGGLGMIFVWLFPLGFLALLILGVIWLVKAIAQPAAQTFAVSGRTCPNCGRPAQADWQVCPYCGQSLAQPGPVKPQTP